MNVEWAPAWLTWVSATTTCLRALGEDCDAVDVAGMSGYAFVMNVHRELCPSGPTVFDWGMLPMGVHFLGRSTLQFACGDCHTAERASDLTRGHCRAAYEVAAREVAEGRPCVLWGAYVPEFAAVVGVEDGRFHVKSYRECTPEPQPPVLCEELNAPGGPYVLAFPTKTTMSPSAGDSYAIGHAVQLLSAPSPSRDYGFGLAAYDTWIAALEANQAQAFGNAYNTQCWAESRHFAHEFLQRVAARNAGVAEPLNRAIAAYGDVTSAMSEVAGIFGFPPRGEVEHPANRTRAVELLRQAKVAETRAAEALAEAAANWPTA
jgi:hypothetical protein